jgi:hypothetical protein
MEWINVRDRLPEPHKPVLLYFSVDDMAVAAYCPSFIQWGKQLNEVWVIDNGDEPSQIIELYRPTHWAIPEPPQL